LDDFSSKQIIPSIGYNGYQPGLDVGSRVYAKVLGFKGMVIGMPFTLEGTDRISIKPKPSAYPEKCGS
jgi:hypothetical protein